MTGGKNSMDGKKNSMETFRKVLRYLGAYRIYWFSAFFLRPHR